MKFPRKTSSATVGATALLNNPAVGSIQLDDTQGLRARLTNLKKNSEPASRALAIAEADIAVTAAEQPHADPAVAALLVYLADRKLATAEGTQAGFALGRRPTRMETRKRDDGLQQKIALGTWEDEGGSPAEHATANSTVTRASDSRRGT